jgi:hypothetical protein
MVLFAAIIIEIALIFEMKRRIRFVTPADLIGAYIIFYQVMYYFGEELGKPIGIYAMDGSFSYFYNEGVIIYFYIFIIVYCSTIGIRDNHKVDFRGVISSALNKALRYQKFAIAFVYFITVLYLVSVNYELLWYNNSYLILKSIKGLDVANGLTGIGLKLLEYCGLIAGFIFCANLFQGKRGYAMLAFPVYAFCALFGLANSSRMAVVMFAIPGLMGWLMLRRGAWLVGLLSGAMALHVLRAVLLGRSAREFGFASIPGVLWAPFEADPSLNTKLLFNLSEGVYSTMDGLQRMTDHPLIYKVLSFSPLPSSIDKFDTIQRTYLVMLGRVFPMSAITEAILFGWPFIVLGALTLFLLVRVSIRTASLSPIAYIFTMPIIILSFIQANAYPVRLVYRQSIYILVLLIIVGVIAKRRRKSSVGHRMTVLTDDLRKHRTSMFARRSTVRSAQDRLGGWRSANR